MTSGVMWLSQCSLVLTCVSARVKRLEILVLVGKTFSNCLLISDTCKKTITLNWKHCWDVYRADIMHSKKKKRNHLKELWQKLEPDINNITWREQKLQKWAGIQRILNFMLSLESRSKLMLCTGQQQPAVFSLKEWFFSPSLQEPSLCLL